ncbi:MAG: hypothetical protein KJ043_08830 [Anaerolineae bacterium]|nr:hypothetical protein [Anaerolineae bacterium]
MRPDRATNIESWNIDALTLILFRQFKRLLADKGVNLTDNEMQAIAESVAKRDVSTERVQNIISALDTLIGESITILSDYGLSFTQSLATDMTNLTHLWNTTADFLAVANEKGNAEIRISAGSALTTLLGDYRYVDKLITAIDHDMQALGTLDVDAMICKRALLFVARIAQPDPQWWDKARTWVASQ